MRQDLLPIPIDQGDVKAVAGVPHFLQETNFFSFDAMLGRGYGYQFPLHFLCFTDCASVFSFYTVVTGKGKVVLEDHPPAHNLKCCPPKTLPYCETHTKSGKTILKEQQQQ